MQALDALLPHLAAPSQIVITTHHKPDGDAMGSSLGLYHILTALGHSVSVITPTDYAGFLHFLPGNEIVLEYPKDETLAAKLVAEAAFIFCLDFNQLYRIGPLGEHVEKAAGIKVMIDHHLEPQGFAAYGVSNTEAAATAELIYKAIVELGWKAHLSKEAATCLYTGIMTDTGSFRHGTTTPAIHRIAADLIEAGADNSAIHSAIYDNNSENRLRFLGFCLSRKLKVIPNLSAAYIAVSYEELQRYWIKTGETEGFVNYPLSIKGVKVSGLIIDRGQIVKLSIRSEPGFPANEFMTKYFKGGGHGSAAGGESEDSLYTTVDRFVKALGDYRHLLTPEKSEKQSSEKGKSQKIDATESAQLPNVESIEAND